MIDLATYLPPWSVFVVGMCAGLVVAGGLLAGLLAAFDALDVDLDDEEDAA